MNTDRGAVRVKAASHGSADAPRSPGDQHGAAGESLMHVRGVHVRSMQSVRMIMSAALPLPPLTADEAAHSRRLVHRIWEEIDARGGWLSFERFMEMALYEPGLGYYSAGATKLGAGGDFVTAPEVSSLFSRCLANQCGEILQHVSGGAILEFGAGSGVMAADLLNELAAQGALPERYLILEVSADLRERQRALLLRTGARARGARRVDRSPAGRIPRRRARERSSGRAAGAALSHPRRPDQLAGRHLAARPARLVRDRVRMQSSRRQCGASRRTLGERLPDGYTSEINLRLAPWIAGVAAALREGVALFIDYGLPQRQYYRTERSEGTLLCHFRHRFHDDPLINVGVQDIGAWVDFTAVAEAASPQDWRSRASRRRRIS